jgi:hypothetical protein
MASKGLAARLLSLAAEMGLSPHNISDTKYLRQTLQSHTGLNVNSIRARESTP